MLNLSDKDLDRISREAAEQYEPDDFTSWEKLEQLLDKEPGNAPPAPPSQRFGIAPIFYSVLFIVLIGSTYFFVKHKKSATSAEQAGKAAVSQKNNPADDEKNNTGSKNNNDSKPAPTENAADQNRSIQPGQAGEDGSASGLKTTAPADTRNNASAEKNDAVNGDKAAGNGASVERTTIAHAKQNENLGASSKEERARHGNHNGKSKNNKYSQEHAGLPADGLSDAAAKQKDANDTDIPTGQDANGSGTGAKQNQTAGLQQDDVKWAMIPGLSPLAAHIFISDSSLRNFRVKKDSAAADITNPNKKNGGYLRINRSLTIGLMYAPDITNVNASSYNKLSSNIGITLGYQFAGKWSINSGVIFTSKNYTAQGKDFRPENRWKDITGNCKMIEIPLTVRYDMNLGRKTLFFVNAGLSSYLMKEETYDYYAQPMPNAPWYYVEKTYSGNDNYWFSIGSLSMGIEQYIGKNISIQVEPFAKLPLSRVGVGQIQLSSYGLSFSLRYSPTLSTKRITHNAKR